MRLEMLRIVVSIALRNLFASRLKTVIVGGIIFFGAFLVVVGTSLLDSVNYGMSRSIIGSTGGHLQVYNAASKDDLALYGGMTGDVDLKPMEDFSRVKRSLLGVPGVRAVVPMGIAEAMVAAGNYFDHALEKLRGLTNRKLAGESTPELEAEYSSLKAHVRQNIELLRKDMAAAEVMVDAKAIDRDAVAARERAGSEEFWAGFDAAPLEALEFLENKIAPQAMDGDMLWVRYVGTDLDAYQQAFDRMEIVHGTAVPKGQRGILLGKLYYEDWIKMKTARRLDKIHEAIAINGKTIARDEELQRLVKENVSQVRDVVVQLDPIKTKIVVERLQKTLGSQETDAGKLLAQLLQTTDENFEARRKAFYDEVAPLVELYRLRVGDTITIKAFTRSGYMKSVNVKIYGIAQFKGLEKSTFASMMSLMDLMSFRDLYGYLTVDKLAELKQLKEAAGAKDVAREDAEAALFGEGAQVVAEAATTGFDESRELGQVAARPNQAEHVYTQEEIETGVALNAAVLLDDERRIQELIPVIEAAAKRDGLNLKVVDWKKAAGMVGQFIDMMSMTLFISVAIIFLIALVIIINAMVMATLQRVKEIGTMRAVGAQRGFVRVMIGIETVAVCLLFGTLGGAAGAGLITWLGATGIPATNDYAYFFFSGPRLHPSLSGGNLIVAFNVVLGVSIAAAFYPALLATRITPLEAMMTSED